MKRLIKVTIFFIILIILFHYTSQILLGVNSSIVQFYDESSNSLDIIYIGASNAYKHFNTLLAYEKYGYTTGMLSSPTQPFPATKYLIKEAEKNQKPKLYIIDIARCVLDFHNTDLDLARATTDTMKFSKNRIDTINKILSYSDVNKREYINYYFNFFLYHNNWKNISEDNYKKNINLYKGYFISEDTVKTEIQEPLEWKKECTSLRKENREVLIDLINYIKEKNINVLFVVPRRFFIETENEMLNDAISIIEENQMKVINFNEVEELDINLENDFCDGYHLNTYGSTKYTLYFAKYLKENYDLPDHSNDPSYSSWNDEYERFKEYYKFLTGRDFNELLEN